MAAATVPAERASAKPFARGEEGAGRQRSAVVERVDLTAGVVAVLTADEGDQQTLTMGAVGWRSSNDSFDRGSAASPPIRISSWRAGTASLQPGQSVVFGVFVARSGSVALEPVVSEYWNGGAVLPFSFPPLTLRTW